MDRRDVVEEGFGVSWDNVEELCKKYGYYDKMINIKTVSDTSPRDKIKLLLFYYPYNYMDMKHRRKDDDLEIAKIIDILKRAKDIKITGTVNYKKDDKKCSDKLSCEIESDLLKYELIKFLSYRLYKRGGYEQLTTSSFNIPEYTSWDDFPEYGDEDLNIIIRNLSDTKISENPKKKNFGLGRTASYLYEKLNNASIFAESETKRKKLCFIYDLLSLYHEDVKQIEFASFEGGRSEEKDRDVRNWIKAFEKQVKENNTNSY